MKITKLLLVIFLSIAVAACGGGGGGGSSTPAASTLGGVAAVGYPIVNGTVQVKCAGGSTLTVTTTSAGAWQATISGQTLPCAVQVSSGTIKGAANPTPYHSIATSFGTANVTPLTDLMVANLAGTATPGVWFAGLTPAAFAQITTISVNTALTNLRIALSGLAPLGTVNPITTAFTATPGTTGDDMLLALETAIKTNTVGVTYTVLLSNASSPGFTPPAAGFGTVLATEWSKTASGGSVISTLSFPLRSGYSARVANGSSTNYTISGSCSGTVNNVWSAPVAGVFEGAAALRAARTSTFTFSTPSAWCGSSGTYTENRYYDSSYAYLGSSFIGYYTVSTNPLTIPASVKVGDTGTLGTENAYADSTKAALLGWAEHSYVVEPDTANTAIINRITKEYSLSSVLIFTQQKRMRITSSGVLTPVSIDTQWNTSTEHVIYTATGGGGAPPPIGATANTTAQNLIVGTAMASFTPLTASGGATSYAYSYTGTLPAGLNFNPSTGAVTGTPYLTYATANLVFSVKDANNVTASTTSTVSFTVSLGTGGGVSGTAAQYFTKTAVGNTWASLRTYNSSQLPSRIESSVSTITASAGGVVTYSDSYTSGGVTNTYTSTIQHDATGALVFTDIRDGVKSTVLPATFAVGTTWVERPGDPANGRSETNSTIAAFNVTRTVPAGTFTDCLQINSTSSYTFGGVTRTDNGTLYTSPTAGFIVESLFTYVDNSGNTTSV